MTRPSHTIRIRARDEFMGLEAVERMARKCRRTLRVPNVIGNATLFTCDLDVGHSRPHSENGRVRARTGVVTRYMMAWEENETQPETWRQEPSDATSTPTTPTTSEQAFYDDKPVPFTVTDPPVSREQYDAFVAVPTADGPRYVQLFGPTPDEDVLLPIPHELTTNVVEVDEYVG